MYDLVLISGVPGSGKSTVSKTLAKKLSRSIYLSGDSLRELVIGGFKDPAKPWDSETKKQYYLSFENESILAKSFIQNGFKVIVDDVIHAGDLYSQWQKYFKDIKYLKVVILPSLETIIQRNRQRGKFVNEDVIRRLFEDFKNHDYKDWLVVDNGNQGIEETVSQIQKKLGW